VYPASQTKPILCLKASPGDYPLGERSSKPEVEFFGTPGGPGSTLRPRVDFAILYQDRSSTTDLPAKFQPGEENAKVFKVDKK
jgi:hypothetical protein